MADIQRVLISYTPDLRAEAEVLAATLESNGLKTWVDFNNLRPGQKWYTELENALDSCEASVVLTTPNPEGTRALNVQWETILRKTWTKDDGFLLPVVFGEGATPPLLASWVPLQVAPGTPAQHWTGLVLAAITSAKTQFGEAPLDKLFAEQTERARSLESIIGYIK